MELSSEIILPIDQRMIEPSLAFVDSCTRNFGLGEASLNVRGSCQKVLELILERNSHKYAPPGFIRVAIHMENKETGKELKIRVQNKGQPIFLEEFQEYYAPGKLEELREKRGFLGVDFKNLGRGGQSVEFRVALPQELELNGHQSVAPTDPQITMLKPEHAAEISQLFYRVYRYRYINEYVYYPEKLREMMASGRLSSIGARTPDGLLVGHVGLLRWNENPGTYEAALGVVDTRVKGNGLFGKMFEEIQNVVKRTPMAYCLYDFVTNHDFSQRMVAKNGGYTDLALYLGCQVSNTQAKLEELGLGKDPGELERYSLLVGIGRQTDFPFGTSITLPTNIGEACGFLLESMNIRWNPAARFCPLPTGGRFATLLQAEQRAVIFDFYEPGRSALAEIIDSFKKLLKDGYQYFSVDVPIQPYGLGQIYDLLAQNGFFFAGFIPYQIGNQLGFRFQFLVPIQVNFEGIKILSNDGKKLLDVVKTNYERNKIL